MLTISGCVGSIPFFFFYTFNLSFLYSGRSNVLLKYSVGEPVSSDQDSWHLIDSLVANANTKSSALLKKENKPAKTTAKE